jgi:MFS family permease
MSKYYGLIVGLLYTLPFSIAGLVMGALSDKFNRKLLLGVTMILSSLTSVVSGLVDSFPVLCGMRVLQGSLHSATKPLSYSLVTDLVPPENRSTANSILNSGVYIGIALSSLSIIMIK